MSATIPVLWSDDISVDVLSPLAILRAQQLPLTQRTKGLLTAELDTITSERGRIRHQFDLIAPALDNFRYRLLSATHYRDFLYPVIVSAECFLAEDGSPMEFTAQTEFPHLSPGERRASTYQEFVHLVGEVLHSSQIRSVIQSLIARSNDQRNAAEPSSPPNGQEDGE